MQIVIDIDPKIYNIAKEKRGTLTWKQYIEMLIENN